MSHREQKKKAKKGSSEKTKSKFVSAEDMKKETPKGSINPL